MRYSTTIIAALVVSCTAVLFASENEVTCKTKELSGPDGNIGQFTTYYRNGKRILVRELMRDKNGKTLLHIEMFCFGADCVYARDIARNDSDKAVGEIFFSRPGISVCIKPAATNIPRALLMVKDDDEIIEWFEQGSDGFFVPVPADNFAQVKKVNPALHGDFGPLLGVDKKL